MIYDLSKVKDRRWKYSILAGKGELFRKIKKYENGSKTQ